MADDGDFDDLENADTLNPKMTECYNMLRSRSKHFLLTSNDTLIQAESESDSEDEYKA